LTRNLGHSQSSPRARLGSESSDEVPQINTAENASLEELLEELKRRTESELTTESANIQKLVAEKELRDQKEDLLDKLDWVKKSLDETAIKAGGLIISDVLSRLLERGTEFSVEISSDIRQTSNHAEIIDAIKQSVTESKEKITEESLSEIVNSKYSELAAKQPDKSQVRSS